MMHTPPESEAASVAGPTGEPLISFLRASSNKWSAITEDVDPDAIVMFGLIEALARTWKEIHAEALSVYDLNLAEWTTIGMLRTSPPGYRRSPTELRRLVGQTSAGMTRILTKLVDGRLVRREPSPSDGRGLDVILTPRGHVLAETSFRGMHAIQRELLAPCANDQRVRLIAALDGLRVALTARQPNPGKQPPA